MSEFVATMTRRGQITIPAEVRRLLKLNPREKVAFVVDGDDVRLVPLTFTVESAFGSIEPLDHDGDFDDQIRDAKEERAARVARELAAR